MHTTSLPFAELDIKLTRWLARHALVILRLSIGVIFFWFGILKFFPGQSPAEDLAARTIHLMTFGLLPSAIALPLLATWEVAIGLGFLTGRCLRATVLLLAGQMIGAATPLVLFAHETFTAFPYAPTLEGQYIIKNLVLLSAGLVIGAVVRGGRLLADPLPESGARR